MIYKLVLEYLSYWIFFWCLLLLYLKTFIFKIMIENKSKHSIDMTGILVLSFISATLHLLSKLL